MKEGELRPEAGLIPARWDLASVAVLIIRLLKLRREAKSVRGKALGVTKRRKTPVPGFQWATPTSCGWLCLRGRCDFYGLSFRFQELLPALGVTTASSLRSVY